MRRRELILVIGGAAVMWPLKALAQQPMPVIGWLSIGSQESDAAVRLTGFRAIPATLRAGTSRSSTVGQRANTTGCRAWRPIWFLVLWR